MAALGYGDWLARGRAHQRNGYPVDAMLCFRHAGRLDARATDPRFHLGEVLWQLGLFAEAIAAWRDTCAVDARHQAAHYALAEALLATGDAWGAREVALRCLTPAPDNPRRSAVEAAARLFLATGKTADAIAERDAAVTLAVAALANDPALCSVLSVAGPLALALDRIPQGEERADLLVRVRAVAMEGGDPASMPALLLALLCESATSPEDHAALFAPSLSRGYLATDHDALRRIARAAAAAPEFAAPLAALYATLCQSAFAPHIPLVWPRRTAGVRTRVVVLVGVADGVTTEAVAAVLGLARDAFDVALATLGAVALEGVASSERPVIELQASGDAAGGHRVAALDPDILIDLVGLYGPTGVLLAQRPARTTWTLETLATPNAAPLIQRTLADGPALVGALYAVHKARDPSATATLDAEALAALWTDAVRAHQKGDAAAALDCYDRMLAEQPDFAMALYLRGVALRERGEHDAARAIFERALAVAPDYLDARLAAASAAIDAREAAHAVVLVEAALSRAPHQPALWRSLGLARLAQRDGPRAADAFAQALALAPTDADTYYNHGVALQMRGDVAEAARAYQRALVFRPDMVAADFNLGVLFQEQGANDAAIAAYGNVLRANPTHVKAYKNLGEVLFAAGRVDLWLANFERFEAHCPDALPLAVQALEACQYMPDFARLERYLEGLRQEKFRAADELELADALEELLYLLLYYDVEPEMIRKFGETYDPTARRIYGEPLPPPSLRRPGRIRLGYVSGDLRNHVQGKMVWQAVQHHDKSRFELHFYSLSRVEDEWTARFRGIADGYEVIAGLSERQAAERIAADDLDLLIDLGTHTRGAKPGIFALKPARVQITHVASAGTLGLSTVDFKLTDCYADLLPDNQAFQIETLLPMEGCVYPYRTIAPATEHPFQRERLGIAADTVVIGAFVSGLKLSRRCLSLWSDVMNRIPRAKLAFSPVNPAMRVLYTRLAAAGGIAPDRLLFLPQGRNDGENQARYNLVDFVLDPMPYGGVNGTLEALDMGVPVVTLVGKRHAERTPYSILANLGVVSTVAHGGREYVDIAVRLADDAAFMREVRAAIRAGLLHSPLTDMPAHTRNLERAYLAALAERAPAVLAAIDSG